LQLEHINKQLNTLSMLVRMYADASSLIEENVLQFFNAVVRQCQNYDTVEEVHLERSELKISIDRVLDPNGFYTLSSGV